MATIDIALPDSLTSALTPPPCVDLRLPKPGSAQLRLPNGATFKAIGDITKGIPNDCSMNFNIALQLAPMMASMECLLKVLKFISVLIEAIKSFSSPPKIPGAILDIVKAGEDLLECLNMVLLPPLGMIPFVKDLLLLLAKMLRCAASTLKSAIAVLDGIGLDMLTAQQAGNDALLQQLQCAQENAELAMQGAMVSVEPVMIILDLAGPFLSIAGVSLDVPPIASDGTLDGMKSTLETMETVAQTLQDVAEALPG